MIDPRESPEIRKIAWIEVEECLYDVDEDEWWMVFVYKPVFYPNRVRQTLVADGELFSEGLND